MRLLRNLALVLVGLFVATEMFAQTTPMMNQTPWWDYRPERITNNFQTIIGEAGTVFINGTRNAGWTDQTADFVSLPFDFNFMRTRYAAGFRIAVFTTGSFSFSGNTRNQAWGIWRPETFYYQSNSQWREQFHRLVSPYWTDAQTSGVSSPTGGVYYRTDGVAPNRIFTLEWRNRGGRFPVTSPTNFQAKLYENNSAIEFHYSEDASFDRTIPQGVQSYGALIGARNVGQRRIARELTPEDFNNDEDNFVYFIHPDQSINGRQPGEDTVSFTRINTVNDRWTGAYSPVRFAFSEGASFTNAPSPYWHYSYPEEFGAQIAYRLRPILNDVACDSVWFTPTNAINAYTSGSGIIVNARFQNRASNVKNNIPTRFDVYYGGQKQHVYTSEQQLTSPGNRLGTDNVSFNAIPGTTNPAPSGNSRNGIYEVRVYPQDPLEEDFKNDTCKISLLRLGSERYHCVPHSLTI